MFFKQMYQIHIYCTYSKTLLHVEVPNIPLLKFNPFYNHFIHKSIFYKDRLWKDRFTVREVYFMLETVLFCLFLNTEHITFTQRDWHRCHPVALMMTDTMRQSKMHWLVPCNEKRSVVKEDRQEC